MTTYVLGTIDAGGDGKTVLLANVNAINNTNFTLTQFDFGLPQPITVPNPSRNTRIALMPLSGTGFYGSRWVYYNRIHPNDLGEITVLRGAATRVVDLLPQINDKYGILITAADIYDAELPPAVPGEDSVALDFQFRETSIIYYGGTYITLGNADPTQPGGGTVPTTPFATDLVGLVRQSLDLHTDYFEMSTVMFDVDRTRTRQAALGEPGVMDFTRMNQYDEQRLDSPYVFAWKSTAGAHRALMRTGEVVQLDTTANLWTHVTVVNGADLGDPEVFEQQYDQNYATFGVQNTSGVLWTALGDTLYTSANNGTSWTVEPVSNPQAIRTLDLNVRGNMFRVDDALVHNGKLFLLIFDTTPYSDDTGNANARGVEIIDLVNGTASKQSLHGLDYRNGEAASFEGIEEGYWAFQTPYGSGGWGPVVVGAVQLHDMDWLMHFQPTSGGVYEVTALRHDVTNVAGDRTHDFTRHNYVNAYEVALAKNTHVLEVIEWGTVIESVTPSNLALVAVRRRPETDWYSYGVLALTRLRSAAGTYTPWVQSKLKLPGKSASVRSTCVHNGRRTHFHAQGGVGLMRMTYTEDDTRGGFVVTIGHTYAYPTQANAAAWAPVLAGEYRPTLLVESSNTTYALSAYTNAEETKALIDYSFVLKNSQGVALWYVSPPAGSTLAQRQVGADYGEVAASPVVTFTRGNALFLIGNNGYGLVSTTTGGRNWVLEGRAPKLANSMESANATHASFIDNLLKYKPEDFRQGFFNSSNLILQVRASGAFQMTETYNHRLPNYTYNYVQEKLVTLDLGQTSQGDSGELTSTGGVNVVGQYAPARVDAWKFDTVDDSLKIYGHYTTVAGQEYAQVQDTLDYANVNVPSSYITLGVWDDLQYVGLKRVYVGHTLAGSLEQHSLITIDQADAAVTVGLSGTGGAQFPTFRPEAGFYLWDHQEGDNYVPFVLYGNKRLLVLNRFDEEGEHSWGLHTLTFAGDNGAPVTLVPMLNQNRREYLLAQKGNGIFRITYAYAPLTKVTTVGVTRLFTLSSSELSALDVVTGTKVSSTAVTPPTSPITPTYPPDGTLLSWACQGFDKIGTYADGAGGTYEQLAQANSPDCGFVAPPPGGVGADSAEIVLNSSSGEVVETDTLAGEDGNAFVVWNLAEALNADATFNIALNHVTTTSADIGAVHYQVGYDGGWNPLTLPSDVVLPAGDTTLCLRIAHTEDATTEGTETYEVILTKVSSNITNTAPITTVITLNDTSLDPVVAEVWTPALFSATNSGPSSVVGHDGTAVSAMMYRLGLTDTYVSTGKHYWEVEIDTQANLQGAAWVGIAKDDALNWHAGTIGAEDNAFFQQPGVYGFSSTVWGRKVNNATLVAFGAGYNPAGALDAGETKAVLGYALDLDAGTFNLYINGVDQGEAFTGIPAGNYSVAVNTPYTDTNKPIVVNFGQRDFVHEPPVGFTAGFGSMKSSDYERLPAGAVDTLYPTQLDKNTGISAVPSARINGRGDIAFARSDALFRTLMPIEGGKWYWEVTPLYPNTIVDIGIGDESIDDGVSPYLHAVRVTLAGNNLQTYVAGAWTNMTTLATDTATIGLYFDADAATLGLIYDGNDLGLIYTGIVGAYYYPTIRFNTAITPTSLAHSAVLLNVGQEAFKHTVPDGYFAGVGRLKPLLTLDTSTGNAIDTTPAVNDGDYAYQVFRLDRTNDGNPTVVAFRFSFPPGTVFADVLEEAEYSFDEGTTWLPYVHGDEAQFQNTDQVLILRQRTVVDAQLSGNSAYTVIAGRPLSGGNKDLRNVIAASAPVQINY